MFTAVEVNNMMLTLYFSMFVATSAAAVAVVNVIAVAFINEAAVCNNQ